MTAEICGDNRFEIIDKAKKHLLEATNIDTSTEEMAVIDSFLFRCWQMGWLDKYDTSAEPSRTKMEKEKMSFTKFVPDIWIRELAKDLLSPPVFSDLPNPTEEEIEMAYQILKKVDWNNVVYEQDEKADRPQGENLMKDYPSLFTCSVCGVSCDDTLTWDCVINYCPNCGAFMGEKDGK